MKRFKWAAKIAAFVIIFVLAFVLATEYFEDWFVIFLSISAVFAYALIRKHYILISGLILYERLTTLISRIPDALSVVLLLNGIHVVIVFLINFFINAIMYIVFIKGYYFLPKFKETLEEFNTFKKKEILWSEYGWNRLLRWAWDKLTQGILKSRILIFLVGSPIFLDPDWVTFVLMDGNEIKKKDYVSITIPSVFIASIFWTGVCALGVYGFWIYEDFIANIWGHFLHIIIRN